MEGKVIVQKWQILWLILTPCSGVRLQPEVNVKVYGWGSLTKMAAGKQECHVWDGPHR